MRRRWVVISALFHLAVFIAVIISAPQIAKNFDIPVPVAVELVEIDKLTQTNKPPAKVKSVEKKEEKPPPPPKKKKPPAAKKNTAKEAAVPVKKKTEAVQKPKPEKKKEDKVLVDESAAPTKKKTKKEEKKKETTTQDKPDKDFSSVLKNLELQDDPPAPADEEWDLNLEELFQKEMTTEAPLGNKMTISEEDALRRQLEQCWSVPFGARDAENLSVDVFMVINEDRTLRAARVVDQKKYQRDSFFRAAADSALRAVRNPLCSPFALPDDKYDIWKTTIVTFDPSMMF